MQPFLSKIIKFNSLTVLGLYKEEDTEVYFELRLKKRNNRLAVVSCLEHTALESFISSHDRKQPVILVVDGKGVLHKRVDTKNAVDLAWKNNIDFSSVYYTELSSLQYTFLSFCRAESVDNLITVFQTNGVQLLDVYIGGLSTTLLKGSIGEDRILSNRMLLEFEGENLIDFGRTDQDMREYMLDKDVLTSFQLPLYGAAVHFYVQSGILRKSSSKLIDPEELLYRKAFNYLGVGVLGSFLLALLASYLLTQYYGIENSSLNQENVFSNQAYGRIKELESQRDEKMEVLSQTGQMSAHFLSYYVYELSGSVPVSIVLDEVSVFPLTDQIKANKRVGVRSGEILVKGSTLDEAAFNQWLKDLRQMKWIKEFEILSLKRNRKGIQLFHINILVSDV